MMKKLSYRKKNWLLLPGFALAIFLCYQCGFKRTIAIYSRVKEVKMDMGQISNLEQRNLSAQLKLDELNSKLGLTNAKRDEVQREFLRETRNICDSLHIGITDVRQLHVRDKEQFIVVNSCITLEGAFVPLLRAIYQLENESSEAKIVSCDFKALKDLKTGITKLYATIYAQSVLYK